MNIYEAYKALINGEGIIQDEGALIICTNEPLFNTRRFYFSGTRAPYYWQEEIKDLKFLTPELFEDIFTEIEEVCLEAFESTFESFPLEKLADRLRAFYCRIGVEKDE